MPIEKQSRSGYSNEVLAKVAEVEERMLKNATGKPAPLNPWDMRQHIIKDVEGSGIYADNRGDIFEQELGDTRIKLTELISFPDSPARPSPVVNIRGGPFFLPWGRVPPKGGIGAGEAPLRVRRERTRAGRQAGGNLFFSNARAMQPASQGAGGNSGQCKINAKPIFGHEKSDP